MERTIVVSSLAGIVVIMHLGLQMAVGFPNGCLGLMLVPGDLASCGRMVHGGLPVVAGMPVVSVMTGLLAAIAGTSIAFFVVAYLAPPLGRWVALVRLGVISMAAGVTTYYVIASSIASGGAGAIAAVMSVMTGISLLFALASTLISPRTPSAIMSSQSLSDRTFKRETAFVIYLVALAIVLVGADYAAYDALSTGGGEPGRTTSLLGGKAALSTGE
ncbi:hypothetical protein CRI94_12925 [Longibacter salinarum]|uniref:Uncharacterized protein n=2 Tax=Longibacter salinarum TaxID=1850348 RepID=A0A2A8CWB6_9BACT|nr:hypothetical protein CRI94_12925 [Longibacter salinarum]